MLARTLREKDFVVGDVVVFGALDAQGNDTDLPKAVESLLMIVSAHL